MTTRELELARHCERHASPAPWPVRRMPNKYPSSAGDQRTHPAVRGLRVPQRIYDRSHEQVEADVAFISTAREAMPQLIAEVDHLRHKLRECRAAILNLADVDPSVSAKAVLLVCLLVEAEEQRWESGLASSSSAQVQRWRDAFATVAT
jgi:hypothetical protein